MNDIPILMLPGHGGSGPDHWQSLWAEARAGALQVEQRDWDAPEFHEWMAALRAEISSCVRPPLLVAHSLGCAMVAHLAAAGDQAIAGALLVAPADVEEISMIYPELEAFAPMPLSPMAWPTIVVSSDDDVYVGPERARAFADAWGADFRLLSGAGHINADSNLGDWPVGQELLGRLLGE
ncbi:MAG: putative alpha/beta hydrolase family esterase [Hyphomicrobiaceae bacterium]|jgi:predicted alpha/beta hydrolase family esterase